MWLELLLVLIGLLTYFLFGIRQSYKYFSSRNIPCADYKFLLGSNFDLFKRKVTLGQSNQPIYEQLKGNRWGGFYQITKPIIMIMDPELIRAILIKDFNHFHDHGKIEIDEKVNPLDAHLFSLMGDKWRTLRHKLAPTFSSGKLKWMFEGAMAECGTGLSEELDKIPKGVDIEIKDLFARFSTDVIASCAFGIDGEAMKDPNCKFRQMAKDIFNPPDMWLKLLKGVFRLFFPKVFLFFKMKSQPKSTEDFFVSITKQAFEHRLKTGEKRPDFLQLLLELREKGSVDMEGEKELNGNLDHETLEITDELLAAQSFIFFLAGFENTATTMSLVSYFLSKDTDIQLSVKREIKDTLAKHNNAITYDSLREMKLLEACVNEALRLFPLAEAIFRECNKTYHLPEGTINEGDGIEIPVYSLHLDPQYFPNPCSFQPQRFLEMDTIIPGTYLPFGDGPRICIAQRFAILQIKLGLCKLLQKCSVEPSEKNIEPIKMSPGQLGQIEGGLWIKLKDDAL